MTADDDVEVIFSALCADVEFDGHSLTVEIYKTYIDPGWIMEVVNEFGTSTVFDDPFIADGLAWQQFEKKVQEEGLAVFLTKTGKRQLFHCPPQGFSTLQCVVSTGSKALLPSHSG